MNLLGGGRGLALPLAFLIAAFSLSYSSFAEERDSKPNATIYAICDDSFELQINGKTVLSGDKREHVATVEAELVKGDKIAVKCLDFGKGWGFACVVKFSDPSMKPIASDLKEWKCYKPKDPKSWGDPKGISQKQNVKPGTNTAWKNHIIQKTGVVCESIWGDAKDNSVAFLVYEVK